MRLVICDVNRMLGEALTVALETGDDEIRAASVTTAAECVAAVSSNQPDTCVLDLRLPETADGLRVVREICSRFPGTAVVVLGGVSDPGTLAKAKKLGITGFLSKSRSVSELAGALHKIAAGQRIFDPVPRTASRPAPPFVLTPREAEVLRRIADGQDTRQMADEMNIAVSTLRTYIKSVFAKIGVHSRLEAAAFASRANLLGEMPSPPLSPHDQQNILPSA